MEGPTILAQLSACNIIIFQNCHKLKLRDIGRFTQKNRRQWAAIRNYFKRMVWGNI